MTEIESLKQQNNHLKVVVASQLQHMKSLHEVIVSLLDGEGPEDADEVALAKAALSSVPLAVDIALRKLAEKGIFPTEHPPSLASCL